MKPEPTEPQVHVSDALYNDLKAFCNTTGRQETRVVDAAIRGYLKKMEKKK